MKTTFQSHILGTALAYVAGAVFYVAGVPRAAAQGFENLDSGLVAVSGGADGDGLRTAVDLTRTFRELNQGNAVAPLFLLHGLRDEKGRSMLDLLGRYGFMADGGPRPGVASGFTLAEKSLPFVGFDISTSGFSCTACHSGEFEYKGSRYRVDGMPGLVDIEGWTLELSRVVGRNNPITHKGEFLRSLKRAVRYSYDWRARDDGKPNGLMPRFEQADLERFEKSVDDLLARGEAAVPAENGMKSFSRQTLSADPELRGYQLSILGGVYGGETKAAPDLKFLQKETDDFMLRRQQDKALENQREKAMWGIIGEMSAKIRREYDVLANRYANGKSLIAALKSHPSPGYGRDDAWGLIDRYVGGAEKTVLNRPIAIPPLFGCGNYLVFHCDGNTNSMMDRNIAQAVALGAGVEKSGAAGVSLREIYHANRLAAKLHGPDWPPFFPPLDMDRVARGKALFEERKYDSYKAWDYLGNPLPVRKAACADCHSTPTGISKQRYYDVGTNLVRLNHYPEQPGMLAKVADELMRIRTATRKYGVNKDITDMEARSWERDDAVWWREQRGYVARALDGIWASPPYLHNGSVPTLRDMLRPAAERPAEFHVGGKTFDPVDVGFVSEKTAVSYRFDTTRPENGNEGHGFGTELPEADRDALLEYLKTFSRGSRWGD